MLVATLFAAAKARSSAESGAGGASAAAAAAAAAGAFAGAAASGEGGNACRAGGDSLSPAPAADTRSDGWSGGGVTGPDRVTIDLCL